MLCRLYSPTNCSACIVIRINTSGCVLGSCSEYKYEWNDGVSSSSTHHLMICTTKVTPKPTPDKTQRRYAHVYLLEMQRYHISLPITNTLWWTALMFICECRNCEAEKVEIITRWRESEAPRKHLTLTWKWKIFFEMMYDVVRAVIVLSCSIVP